MSERWHAPFTDGRLTLGGAALRGVGTFLGLAVAVARGRDASRRRAARVPAPARSAVAAGVRRQRPHPAPGGARPPRRGGAPRPFAPRPPAGAAPHRAGFRCPAWSRGPLYKPFHVLVWTRELVPTPEAEPIRAEPPCAPRRRRRGRGGRRRTSAMCPRRRRLKRCAPSSSSTARSPTESSVTWASSSVRSDAGVFLHDKDLRDGYGSVYLPYALAKKYPFAASEWGWRWAFPAASVSVDPRSGKRRRHHLHPRALQRAIRAALRKADVAKHAGIHILRHSFATHLLERVSPPLTRQARCRRSAPGRRATPSEGTIGGFGIRGPIARVDTVSAAPAASPPAPLEVASQRQDRPPGVALRPCGAAV